MALPIKDIHPLEISEQYPAAIIELEKRIAEGQSDLETVTRLGFNLWYAVVEELRLELDMPTDQYRKRFVELLRTYEPTMGNDPDFCWAYGLGISLFPEEFDGLSESDGTILLQKAAKLDPFYPHLINSTSGGIVARYNGRGIFESYYNISAYPPTEKLGSTLPTPPVPLE